MEGITLKRNDVPDCKCGESSKEVEFWGSYSRSTCSHFHSDKDNHSDGWWLRIDHTEDFDPESGFVRGVDRIGELMCPKCLKAHNKKMAEFF